MRKSILSFALIAGLFLPIGASQAQDTNTVTATCKDGTAFTGATRSGACRGHGGVQSWGTAATAAGPSSHAFGSDEPTHYSEARWRHRSGLGQYSQQGVSLLRHSLVRQDQTGQLFVGGGGESAGRPPGPWEALQLVDPCRKLAVTRLHVISIPSSSSDKSRR
jgi:hypothetical protein